jgi:hypothetical protein
MSSNDDIIIIINRTALIENLLNQVIQKYCSPRKEASVFFGNVVLDCSIMPLGAKVKVAMAIAQEIGFEQVRNRKQSLHDIIKYRNAFAHHAVDAHPTISIRKDPEQSGLHFMLYIIESSGETKRIRRDEALENFNTAYEEAKQLLVEIRDAIRV